MAAKLAVPAPQPIKAVLASRRQTTRSVARSTGYSEHHLSRVFNGWEDPSDVLQMRMSRLLGLPQSALFRP